MKSDEPNEPLLADRADSPSDHYNNCHFMMRRIRLAMAVACAAVGSLLVLAAHPKATQAEMDPGIPRACTDAFVHLMFCNTTLLTAKRRESYQSVGHAAEGVAADRAHESSR